MAMSEALLWRAGAAVPAREATVPALDTGALYGDGLFETLRTYGGRPAFLDAHLERLARSAAELEIEVPARAELERAVTAAIAALGAPEAYVRLSVTRGTASAPGLRAAAAAEPAAPAVLVAPLPAGDGDTPATAVLLDPRLSPPAPLHKSLSWQHAVRATRAAGGHEGLYVDADDQVTEGITTNVFAILGDVLQTPPADRCLPGVTRAVVLGLAERAGLEPREAPLGADVLRGADEVVLTGSLAEVRAVTAIDGEPVGAGRAGPRHAALLAAYREAV